MSAATDAALRLLAVLPVRTHEQMRGPERGEQMRAEHRTPAPTGKIPARKPPQPRKSKTQGGHNRRAVAVGNKRYLSIRAAVADQKISSITLYDWLDNGKARYL